MLSLRVLRFSTGWSGMIQYFDFVSYRDFTVEVSGKIEYSTSERQTHKLSFISYTQIIDTHDNISKGGKNYSKPMDFSSL